MIPPSRRGGRFIRSPLSLSLPWQACARDGTNDPSPVPILRNARIRFCGCRKEPPADRRTDCPRMLRMGSWKPSIAAAAGTVWSVVSLRTVRTFSKVLLSANDCTNEQSKTVQCTPVNESKRATPLPRSCYDRAINETIDVSRSLCTYVVVSLMSHLLFFADRLAEHRVASKRTVRTNFRKQGFFSLTFFLNKY